MSFPQYERLARMHRQAAVGLLNSTQTLFIAIVTIGMGAVLALGTSAASFFWGCALAAPIAGYGVAQRRKATAVLAELRAAGFYLSS